MTFIKRETVTFTTDASGDATVYSNVVNGGIYSVIFTDTDTDAGADFTITCEDTGQAIVTATNAGGSDQQYQPRQAVHDTSAAAIADLYDHIAVVNERVKIVVAQGGNAKSGQFDLLFV